MCLKFNGKGLLSLFRPAGIRYRMRESLVSLPYLVAAVGSARAAELQRHWEPILSSLFPMKFERSSKKANRFTIHLGPVWLGPVLFSIIVMTYAVMNYKHAAVLTRPPMEYTVRYLWMNISVKVF